MFSSPPKLTIRERDPWTLFISGTVKKKMTERKKEKEKKEKEKSHFLDVWIKKCSPYEKEYHLEACSEVTAATTTWASCSCHARAPGPEEPRVLLFHSDKECGGVNRAGGRRTWVSMTSRKSLNLAKTQFFHSQNICLCNIKCTSEEGDGN